MENVWLSVPDVADMLDVRHRDVRVLVSDHTLLAVRREDNTAAVIHRDELVWDGERWSVLSSLRGTILALLDAGFSENEAMEWLLSPNDLLRDESPLSQLRAGNIHAVRRAVF